jgi:lipopolysaccharide heptosyltransferase II
MKFGFMKFLDRWIGTPLCLALTAFRYLITPLRWFKRRPREIRRVILIKFFGLGSMLMAVPMLRAIRRAHPGATLHFVTFGENRAVLEGTGLVDEIIAVSPKGPLRFAADAFRVLIRLMLLRAQVVIDLEYFSRFSVMLAYLSFAPIRVGFYLPQVWRGGLLTHRVYYNHFKHVTEVYLALAGAIGAEPGPPERPAIAVPGGGREEASRALAGAGVDLARGYVAVNPNASPLCLERRWPAEYFAELADRMIERCGAQVVYVGSPSEREYAEHVRGLSRRADAVKNLAGSTSLEGAIGILRGARLVVTNDSGLLHLAAAVGAPVVALFGPETPTHYAPLAARARIFYKAVYCSPCLNAYNFKTAPCNGNNICMKQITVDEVFQAVSEELSEVAHA